MRDEAEDKKLGGHEMGISRAGKTGSKKEKAVIVLTSQTWKQIIIIFFNNTIINEKEKLGVERRRVWSRVKVEWLKVGADFICRGSGEMKKKAIWLGHANRATSCKAKSLSTDM